MVEDVFDFTLFAIAEARDLDPSFFMHLGLHDRLVGEGLEL